jgi:hypothetical protein
MRALALDELIGRLPPADAQFVGYGIHPASAELRRRLRAGVELSPEQWRRVLVDLGTLRWHARWPAGELFALSLRPPAWSDPFELVLLPERTDVPLALARMGMVRDRFCGNAWHGALSRWDYQPLGRLPPGPQPLPLRLELRALRDKRIQELQRDDWDVRDALDRARGGPGLLTPRPSLDPEPVDVLVATSELVLDVTIVPTLDDALPPVSSPAVDAAVGTTLSLRFDADGAWLHADAAAPDDPRLAGLARVLAVEVLEDAAVRARLTLRPTQEDFTGFGWLGGAVAALPPALAFDRIERARWTVRVRGSDDGILHSWGCDRRWTGEVVVSLDELLDRGYALER